MQLQSYYVQVLVVVHLILQRFSVTPLNLSSEVFYNIYSKQ